MEKKTIIKVILLVVAVITAILMIVGFAYTKALPPKQFVFDNQHDKMIQRTVRTISKDSLENRYNESCYLIRRITNEELIDLETSDKRIEDLVVKYIPLFISRCNEAFNSPQWDLPEWSHSFMKYRIEELQNLNDSKENKVIEAGSEYNTQFADIVSTIGRYDEAWALSTKTNFESLATTKLRVNKADEFKNDDKLKNCTALVEVLDALPGKIKASHLNSLKNSARNLMYYPSLANYTGYISSLKSLYNTRLNEYSDYYKETSDINSIKNELRGHQLEVLDRYISQVTNVSKYYYYSDYKNDISTVYNYIDSYVGGDSKKSELRSNLSSKVKTEEEFNQAKYY